MDVDFSHLNLTYLIQARDLCREDPEMAALLLDIPPHLAAALSTTDPSALSYVGAVSLPLVSPRGNMQWWHRLFDALRENDPAEIQAVVRQLGFSLSNPGRGAD
ncbi:MAG TPA: hypothetical protein VFL54_02235 [Gammaproteobacteria bacterium]|nr:hypothetical protein [Gammaproteobacteria bacterium]